MGWIRSLRRWIRRIFRIRSKRQPSPKILQKWYGNHCAVSRLERNTPGAVATYRITPLQGECDYLLTLDYLPLLQAEMVGQFNGVTFTLRPLNHPHNSALTHRFAVWKIYPNSGSAAVGIWDVDLEGVCPSYSLRSIAPQRAIFAAALKVKNILHSTKTPSMTWQSQMERMNWLGLLEECIRGELNLKTHSIKACQISK